MRKKIEGVAVDADVSREGYYFHFADILLLALDTEGRIEDINDRGLQVLGYERDELIGRDWFDTCLPAESADRVRTIFMEIMTGKLESHQREKGMVVCKDGRERSILWKNDILRNENGEIVGTLSSGEDLTDMLEVEEALRIRDEMLKAVFNSTHDTMALVDRDMRLLMINGSGAARFKHTPEEMTGKDFSQYFRGSSGEIMLAKFKSVVETGKIVDFEDERNNKVFYTKVYPVFGESGTVKWIAVSGEDITYRRRIEQELLRTQKIESIGILAGGIAHDYNNFLTAMMSNISLAMLGMEPGSEARAALEDAEKAARRARDLTMQLLTFAKGGSPVKKVCKTEDILTESVSLGLRGSNIRPEYVIPANTWNVRVDQGQMIQVFNNLTINAKQAMPSGGKILVSAENVTIDRDGPPDMAPGRYVRVLVIDEGIGIPPQYISRVFDPYFSTKQEGSGLGLATAFSIIKQHGGRISIDSDPGKGTQVQLYLPATDEAVSEEPGVDQRLFKGTGRVLVMDDLPEIHKVAGKILAHLGLESEFAFEGREAIEKYKESMEAGRPFDLVIMDLTVPGGLGGKEAVESLLILDPGAKVVVSSGYSSDPIMADFQRYGFAGVIRKPYTVKSVSDVIGAILSPED